MTAVATQALAQAPDRVAARSPAYELVAVVDGADVQIFLDRFATNEPVLDARIEVLAGSTTARAEPAADGTYRARLPALTGADRHFLVFTILHSSGDDLLEAVLDRSSDGSAHGARASFWQRLASPWWLLLALAAGLALGFAAARRQQSHRMDH